MAVAPITLTVTRTFHASRERVFRAWTDPDELARWFWPDPELAMDPRPGGTFHLRDRKYGIGVSGEFTEYTPPARLGLTWVWDGDEGGTAVTLEFHERGAQTELVLTDAGFATDEERDNHVQGWNDCLDRLVRTLTDDG